MFLVHFCGGTGAICLFFSFFEPINSMSTNLLLVLSRFFSVLTFLSRFCLFFYFFSNVCLACFFLSLKALPSACFHRLLFHILNRVSSAGLSTN